MASREHSLHSSLSKFFETGTNATKLNHILNKKTGGVSLRNLEWFLTKFSKARRTTWTGKNGRHFEVHLCYKSSLDGYSKKLFDPFCRTDRIEFMGYTTTLAQLNFIRWVINNDVIEYIESNKDSIMQSYSPHHSEKSSTLLSGTTCESDISP